MTTVIQTTDDSRRYNKVLPIAQNLGVFCRNEFEEAKRYRFDIEQRWLKDLRQYKGIYDPEITARMHPQRSQVFLKITRTKVKTINARMMDMLFPSNGEKNWSISHTPYPELPQQMMDQFLPQYIQATGGQRPPTPDDLTRWVNERAEEACSKMETEMDDQLKELRYRNIIADVINSGNLYGTGILKGPLVEKRVVERWLGVQPGNWQFGRKEQLRPYIEAVSVWDIYPDMTVTTLGAARFLYQRHTMMPQEMRALGERPLFNGELISEYLREYPDGDYKMENYESELLGLSEQQAVISPGKPRKYEVLERWGTLLGKDLIEVGVDGISDDMSHIEFEANIWMIGPLVIKAVLAPIKGVRWPYYFYYFDKDESCIFGEGVPSVIRHSQQIVNSGTRSCLDNAGISSGNIYEVNMDRLLPGENPYDIYANRVYMTTNGEHPELAQYPVVRAYPIPSHTTELLQLVEFGKVAADDESTIPRYLQGMSKNVGGAGETATGLSMLMSNVRITEKEQVQNFDDDCTKLFIKALYHWNMQFNEREDIKGDFEVVAEGFNSLMAKEVLIKQLTEFAAMTANPEDMKWIKRGELLRKLAKQTAFGEKIVRTKEEYEEEQVYQMKMAHKAQLQALMEQAQARGMNPDIMIAAAIEQAAEKFVSMQMPKLQQQQGQVQGGRS